MYSAAMSFSPPSTHLSAYYKRGSTPYAVDNSQFFTDVWAETEPPLSFDLSWQIL